MGRTPQRRVNRKGGRQTNNKFLKKLENGVKAGKGYIYPHSMCESVNYNYIVLAYVSVLVCVCVWC